MVRRAVVEWAFAHVGRIAIHHNVQQHGPIPNTTLLPSVVARTGVPAFPAMSLKYSVKLRGPYGTSAVMTAGISNHVLP